MFVERKRSKTITETVMDYYAEEGDIISLPNRDGYWLVEDAGMSGGSVAAGYPSAWHVSARRLSEKVADLFEFKPEYDPQGETLTFTQHTRNYNNVIDGVQPIGKMRKTFVFECWKPEEDWRD